MGTLSVVSIMAGGVTIQVEGLAKLQKKLGQLPKEVVNEFDVALSSVALEYVGRINEAVPIDTGRLKGGTSLPHKVAVLHYEITNNVEYAPYVEWGTVSF